MSNTDSFIDQVRTGSVRQPNQRGFDPERWVRAFEAIEDPTPRDTSLYASGLVAHSVFSEVRDRVDALGPLPMGRIDEARLLCAVVNRDVWQADATVWDHLKALTEAEGAHRSQALYDRVLQGVGGGNALNISQAIEGSIDGGTLPIRNAVKGWGTGEPTVDADDDVAVIGVTKALYLLGQLYTWLESVWRQCVHGDQELVIEGDRLVFQPLDDALARRRTLAEHRGEAVTMQRMLQVSQELAQMPEVARRIRGRRVLLKAGRREPYRVRVGTVRDNPARRVDAADWLRGRLMFEASYPADLLRAPLPAFDGLTADVLLQAWEALAPFANQVHRTFEQTDVIDTAEGLRAFAPTVSESSLVAGWTRVLGVSGGEARALVRAFTFRGEPRDALWSRPLLRVGDGRLAFVVGAITSPNVRWLIETWLRSGGLDLDARGPWFEADVHRQVQSGLTGSPLGDAWVSDGAVEVAGNPVGEGDPSREEIDLLVRIGATVLVCEVKCSLVPMDDVVADMNYRATLAGGARQATRKARFLDGNRDRAALVVGATAEPKRLRFVPVLITNVDAGVGQAVEGVPVTDASLLRQYLQYGFFLRNVAVGLGSTRGGERHPFYDDDADAEARVSDYLRDPPQLTAFEPLLRDVEMDMATVAGRELVQRYPVVEAVPDLA